jgi:hypothetical protein
VTVVTATLEQVPKLSKPRRKFVAALIATILAVRGRVNYRNLSRYGAHCERTYAQPFPWAAYHAQVIQDAVPASHHRIAAQDASFIPKSGKHTPGLDKFYNGCAGRPERGLEISAVAVVDLTQKGAWHRYKPYARICLPTLSFSRRMARMQSRNTWTAS